MAGKNIFPTQLHARTRPADGGRLPADLTEENMNVKKLTPVLYVDQIEPCVTFWVERLGFQKTVEVPEGDRLCFVILKDREVEIM
jgi:hypothetical protein